MSALVAQRFSLPAWVPFYIPIPWVRATDVHGYMMEFTLGTHCIAQSGMFPDLEDFPAAQILVVCVYIVLLLTEFILWHAVIVTSQVFSPL